ncbi:DUF3293 domain-containing protein [Streptomyces coelicoflavus]|uniref:DUF3293 domain-containing protein n=1 Tax=Streptomyces coelicoflavus TaxID=285562 RepID=UPI002E26928D
MPAVSRFTELTQRASYQRAVVDIALPAHTVRVTQASSGGGSGLSYPLNHVHPMHIITAFNPRGSSTPVRTNLRAQDELLRTLVLRGLHWWPAVGGDLVGTHAEISAAVIGMNDFQARGLGRRFGQDAVFAWSPTSWRLLDCADVVRDTVAAGWHVDLLPVHRPFRSPAA